MGQGEGTGAGEADPEFELCYLDADGGEHRELPAAWPGLRPETFMPAREFRWARSQKHLPGLWWSVTTGSHVGSTPLDPASAAVLGEWLERTSGPPADPLFPARGRTIRKLTRDGFQARLDKYQQIAAQTQPSLAGKRLFPHLFRHYADGRVMWPAG